MSKKIIAVLEAVMDPEIDSFQPREARDAWELLEIACEENNTTLIGEGKKIANCTIFFSIENDDVADGVVKSLVDMGLNASVRDKKSVLLDRRAERLAEKKQQASN
jgi:hypothetical protein